MRTKYKPPYFFSECLHKLSCANLSNLALPKVCICNLTFFLKSEVCQRLLVQLQGQKFYKLLIMPHVRPATLSDVPKSIQHLSRVKPWDLWIVIDHASFNGN